jgi:ferredoxin
LIIQQQNIFQNPNNNQGNGKMNSHALKKAAKEFGADLIGIAPIERFKDLPVDKSPLSIFPECKSVIALGRRVLRGSLRGVEEGTNFGSTYGCFGLRYLEDNFLSKTSYDLTCHIEENGFEAVPIFGYSPEGMPKGRPVKDGKPAPNVILDMEYAAQAAGIAEIGAGGFLISPEFGTRQRIAVILTDCELEADEIMNKNICGDCKACVEACPLGAYDISNVQKFGVKGCERTVFKIDYSVCESCPNGSVVQAGKGSRPDRIAAACGRACLVQLEKASKCSNSFENAFRKRKPWALDAFKRPIESSGKIAVGCDGEAQR